MMNDPLFPRLVIGGVLMIAFVVWMRWPRRCALDELLGPPRTEDSPEPDEQLGWPKRRA